MTKREPTTKIFLTIPTSWVQKLNEEKAKRGALTIQDAIRDILAETLAEKP